MKVNVKNIIFFLAMILVFVLAASFWSASANKAEEPIWSDVVAMFEEDRVTKFVVSPSHLLTLEGVDAEGKEVKLEYQLSNNAQYEYLEDKVLENGVKGDFEAPAETPWFLTYLPYLILIVAVIIMIVMMNRAAGGMGGKMNSFSRARTRTPDADPNNTVKFTDVAGADEEKEELWEVVEFLRDPQKFARLGARIPRGVLLVGPPGTGKTLLAKAVAGEANVPFYSISGSDFVEMYVGVGASRVRDLFDTARKNPASIIFIDEIDAVGRHRGAGLGGGHDEREQTLNQLLVEMDGFGTHQGIIVMAATNRPDVLDPALLRPGRFDRQVTVNYPDIKGREEILRVHAKGKPFEETVSFRKIAQMTVGFTGADLSNLLNEAALLSARRHKNLIGMQDIEDSYMKILLGPRKKSAIRTEKDNRLVAYHEAGHAVASFYAPLANPVKQITILPAGRTGGVTLMVPEEDHL
ncbi:MAG: ATP-dependent zinc metalloprotease FtsH, partial [Clostridia bacterium]|nr:ATP-dependent zinc metalloprotease FtsH [Clostridia bacterium]